MKAVIVNEFGPINNAQVQSIDEPHPGPGEVRIRVHAAELNFPDILVMEGNYQFKPPLPFTPGKAATGVVDMIGDDVDTLKVGDRVAVQVEYGAFTQSLICSPKCCYPMPESINFSDGAALGLVYQTAYFALRERAHMIAGETVLVLGAAGGIGVASVQLAKAMGAGCVIAGVAGRHQIPMAKEAGADSVIDLSVDDIRNGLRAHVYPMTQGKGADIVIDPVGGDVNAAALRCMAWCARMVIIGFASGTIPSIKANYLLVKNISVSGLQWSDYRERTPDKVAAVQSEIFDEFAQGKFTSPVSRVLPLADFKAGLAALKQGDVLGKIVLSM